MIEVNGQYISAEISDIIAELKRQLELNGVKRFYKTIDTPNNLMICCPFHKEGQEKKPSMGIYKKDGTCHCFSCGWVGSLQEMISNCFGYDDMGLYGAKWLIRNFLTLQVEERKDIELDLDRNIRSDNHHHTYVTAEELDSYRWYHPYWAKRRITDESIIELFDLGYDKKTDCITFPVRDKDGNCLFVARRSVRTKYFNYPVGVQKPLYGLFECYAELKSIEKEYDTLDYDVRMDDIIVCESMIDALRFWQVGKYAVALNGTGNALQFKQLRDLPCRKLILCTDMDSAGLKARERIKRNISNKIITEYFLPEGRKDAGECTDEELKSLQDKF